MDYEAWEAAYKPEGSVMPPPSGSPSGGDLIATDKLRVVLANGSLDRTRQRAASAVPTPTFENAWIRYYEPGWYIIGFVVERKRGRLRRWAACWNPESDEGIFRIF